MRYANADFEIDAQDYNYNYKENIKHKDVNDLFKVADDSVTEAGDNYDGGSVTKRNLMDAETRRNYRNTFDLNRLV